MPIDPFAIPFSIENFAKLFEISESKKYLSADEIQQITIAIAKKDMPLLQDLYGSLLAEKVADDAIVDRFLEKQQALMDGAAVQSTEIYNQYILKPKREQMATLEAQQNGNPENILDSFPSINY